MKKTKMSLVTLAMCGLLFANLNVKGFKAIRSGVENPPVVCFATYNIGGNTHFIYCQTCEVRVGSNPELPDTCGE